MRYRLKKDLPFAKAGEEAMLSYGTNSEMECYRSLTGIIVFRINDVKISDKLISEGWIEELKPREWYISETVIRDYARNKKEDLFYYGFRTDIIKIREVLND